MIRKKQIIPWLLGMVVGLLAMPLGYSAAAPQSLRQQVAETFRALPAGPHWALWVKDLTTGKRLYERRSKEFFTPASTLKLITAAAAVDVLTKNFRFKTRLGWRGTVKNGQLNGDLYLHMVGDPTLTTDDLQYLFRRLKKKGIRSITGHLIVDASHFQMVPYGPGWMWDELSYEYAAPMGSIVLNQNQFVLSVTPQAKQSRPRIEVHGLEGVVRVKNDVTVTARHDKWCPLTVYSNDENRYRLGGCLVRSTGKQVRVLGIRRPWPYFKKELKGVLADLSIRVKRGIVLKNKVPKVTWRLSHDSKPLSDLVRRMLKKSDNLIADALFVELGRRESSRGGNWQGGALAIRHFLQKKVGIHTKKIAIVDGSGVSRYNLIRPAQLAEVLLYIHTHKKLYRVIYPALPISGKDGTLQWRTRKTHAKGRVHAKTGTMTGVSALAGYVTRQDGHQLAFSIMMNGWVGKLKKWRAAENHLLTILVVGKG
jgi:serine-type D-Ala-D-Ala carboxypeptidase/endopeptidase (penicillin-binding protein 4)